MAKASETDRDQLAELRTAARDLADALEQHIPRLRDHGEPLPNHVLALSESFSKRLAKFGSSIERIPKSISEIEGELRKRSRLATWCETLQALKTVDATEDGYAEAIDGLKSRIDSIEDVGPGR